MNLFIRIVYLLARCGIFAGGGRFQNSGTPLRVSCTGSGFYVRARKNSRRCFRPVYVAVLSFWLASLLLAVALPSWPVFQFSAGFALSASLRFILESGLLLE